VIFEERFFTKIAGNHATAVFPADWPLFEGHFPGNPVVPAYVLVGLVLAHAERLTGPATLVALDKMKLARPLPPDVEIESELAITLGPLVKVRAQLSSAGSSVGTIDLSLRVGP
jgi:3-hydroxymyristoyl/3-hydroxydecanoyl-(acyl carrier protein) dehydratase